LDCKRFADDEEIETEVRKWLREQSKDFYAGGFQHSGKMMGQFYKCWWRIFREISVFPRFEFNMFFVLYPFVRLIISSCSLPVCPSGSVHLPV
jgi:hypothetical protein